MNASKASELQEWCIEDLNSSPPIYPAGVLVFCFDHRSCYTLAMKRRGVKYFVHILSIALGLVLVWRGMWYVLDAIDNFLFGGSHAVTAATGIVIGILILYLPDKDLKEIQKL